MRMGSYCKAYSVGALRRFPGWAAGAQDVKREKRWVDDEEVEVEAQLTDDDYLYLQEDLTVTSGIFMDENVIFNGVNPDWQRFCEDSLQFRLPEGLAEDHCEPA